MTDFWESGREVGAQALWSSDPLAQGAIALLLVVGGLALVALYGPIALMGFRLRRLNRALSLACRTHGSDDVGDLEFSRKERSTTIELRRSLRSQFQILIRHSPVSIQFEEFLRRWERSRAAFGGESAAVRFDEILERLSPLGRGLRRSLAPVLPVLFPGLALLFALVVVGASSLEPGSAGSPRWLPLLVWGLTGSMALLVIWRGLDGMLTDTSRVLCGLVERSFPASDATDLAVELRRAHARELERSNDRAEEMHRALQEHLDGGLAELARALDKAFATLSEGQEELLASLLETDDEEQPRWSFESDDGRNRATLPARTSPDEPDAPRPSQPTASSRWSLERVMGGVRSAWMRLGAPPERRIAAGSASLNRQPTPSETITGRGGKSESRAAVARPPHSLNPPPKKAEPLPAPPAPIREAAGRGEAPDFDFLAPLLSDERVEQRDPPPGHLDTSLASNLARGIMPWEEDEEEDLFDLADLLPASPHESAHRGSDLTKPTK